MDGSTARTILSLNDQRDRLETEKRQALLAQAEMEHELRILRAMKREITDCLRDRRIIGPNRNTPKDCHHTIGQIARIVRNAQAAS